MTAVLEAGPKPSTAPAPAITPRPGPVLPRRSAASPAPPAAGARRTRALFVLWLAALAGGLALVIYGFGPVFQEREQRRLLGELRAAIDQATNEVGGLPGVSVPTVAPAPGAPVAILEVGALRLQQAVVEGVGSAQTRLGPGHVPGTAGLGQPGNAVVVGRRNGFGGPFKGLAQLREGTPILVSTTQGQTVYEVTSVRELTLHDGTVTTGTRPDAAGTDGADAVYGPTKGNQLTLISSASSLPWNHDRAVVVVADMRSTPFAPTPQGGRQEGVTGGRGDDGARAAGLLAVLLYGAVLGLAVLLYRRLPARTAYLLTVGPALAATIIAGETLSRLLPAWL